MSQETFGLVELVIHGRYCDSRLSLFDFAGSCLTRFTVASSVLQHHSVVSLQRGPFLPERPALLLLQLVLNLLQIFWAVNLNDAIDLARIAHQLFCTGVQHLDFAVTCDWEVV
jgi:hypothetical protein